MKVQQRNILIALALITGVMTVLAATAISSNVRPKAKPVRITTRNQLSGFVVSSPMLMANQKTVGGSSNATPGLVGE